MRGIGRTQDLAHACCHWNCPGGCRNLLAFYRQAGPGTSARRHRDRTAELLVLLSAHDVAHHQHRVERDPVAGQSIDRAAGDLARDRSACGKAIPRKSGRFGVDVANTFD